MKEVATEKKECLEKTERRKEPDDMKENWWPGRWELLGRVWAKNRKGFSSSFSYINKTTNSLFLPLITPGFSHHPCSFARMICRIIIVVREQVMGDKDNLSLLIAPDGGFEIRWL